MNVPRALKHLVTSFFRQRMRGAGETMLDSVPQKNTVTNSPPMASKPAAEQAPSLGGVSGKTNPFLPADAPAANVSLAPGEAIQPQAKVRNFSLRASERLLVLGFADLLLINLALVVALAPATGFRISVENILGNYKWFVTLSIAWLGCATFFDCYSLARAASSMASVRNTILAVITTTAIYLLIPYLTPPLTSRGAIFYFVGLALVLLVGWRVAYVRVFAQPMFQQRALIVGAGAAGIALINAMKTTPQRSANPFRGTGYEIVGYIDDDLRLRGETIEGVSVLGDNAAMIEMVKAMRINELILAITNSQTISDEMMDALLQCREMGLRVVTMATVYERLTGRVPIDYVGRDLYMVLPMDDSAMERAYKIIKRLIDFSSAVAGLAFMAVAIVPIAIVNRLTSPGPLFYKQRRVGQGGKIFEVYKFRSMRPDAERGTGAVWARKGDDRITPAGRIMRKTRIDELPQVINVLKGDMSLIGPRPERPEFVNALSLMIPYYRARHAVKPGITGWAQVKFGYGSTHEDSRIKLEHDLYYVKHASPLLDMVIALQTPLIMLSGKGT
jgi:exopolysaccharide biosynthesis polyprenyl glycosylphosphotransferase